MNSVEEIVREAAKEMRLDTIPDDMGDAVSTKTAEAIITRAIQSALAPVVAELEQAQALLNEATDYLNHGTVCPALGRTYPDRQCDCGLIELEAKIAAQAKEPQP